VAPLQNGTRARTTQRKLNAISDALVNLMDDWAERRICAGRWELTAAVGVEQRESTK
jgi:hypothetical protein